ncbi:MAG: hypothetical protein WD872_20435 [Pirellulaceae bacterium]
MVLLALAATHFLHIKAYWAMHQATPKARPAPVEAIVVSEAIQQ